MEKKIIDVNLNTGVEDHKLTELLENLKRISRMLELTENHDVKQKLQNMYDIQANRITRHLETKK